MVARVDGGGTGPGGEDGGRRSWADHLIARARVFGCQLLPVCVLLFLERERESALCCLCFAVAEIAANCYCCGLLAGTRVR